MPQTSLVAWLSKPAPTDAPKAQPRDEVQSPTLPAVSDDDTPPRGAPKSNMTPKSPLRIKGLPPNVELRECRQEDIKSFKRLNSLLLPIPYGDTFYHEIMEDEVTGNLTLMALWHDSLSCPEKNKPVLVGAIRCRLLDSLPGATFSIRRKEGPMLYLSTLVLLSPYRGHGIAASLLGTMVRRAVDAYGVAGVGAHVWEANEEGLAWYRKRGFKKVSREENYYRRLNPQGAVVVMKDVGVMDLLGD